MYLSKREQHRLYCTETELCEEEKDLDKPLMAEEKGSIKEQGAEKACKNLLIGSCKVSREALTIPPCVQQFVS